MAVQPNCLREIMSAIRSSIAVLAFTLGVTALTFTSLGSVVLNEVDFSPAEFREMNT